MTLVLRSCFFFSDAAAAVEPGAAVAEAVSKLAPGASCDIGSLLKEAESMEHTLKKIRSDQAAESVRREMYG